MKQELTLDYVNQCLAYDPDTGIFIWKERPWHHFKTNHGMNIHLSRFAGKKAGTISHWGYVVIKIDNGFHKAHRLAFLMQTGEMPKCEVDHINGNRIDNRFCNLRLATSSQNNMNKRIQVTNTSGVKGVTWHKRDKVWRASIRVNYKDVWSKNYKNLADAEAGIKEARERIHGEYTNHGQHLCHTPT